MGTFSRKRQAFLRKHRNQGIPNLMLWICIANAVVFVVNYVFQMPLLDLLVFDTVRVSRGEIWRLFSYIFTFASMSVSLIGPLFSAILSIIFYYWVGKVLEATMGTFRFNLFYLTGVLLTDLYLLLIYWIFGAPSAANAHYLNLSMFLAMATLIPEQKVLIYFIIPVKMKWVAWLDLGICLYETVSTLYDAIPIFSLLPASFCIAIVLLSLAPWICLLNYFLFFGKQCKHLFPALKAKYQQNKRRQQFVNPPQQEPNPDWAKNYRNAAGERPYRHKCTVCGRTDVSCPGLDFRYCSRCKGYFCYCIDHINNHSHVE